MSKYLTKEQLGLKLFLYAREKFGSQFKLAEHYGVSRQYICSVCNAKKTPNAQMLEDLGYEKVTVYRRKNATHS